MKSQSDKVKAHLIQQAHRVLSKVRRKNYQEVSNMEDILYLFSQSVSKDLFKQFTEEQLEALNSALATLTEEEMQVVTKRYWEAKSLEIIANEMGHLGHHEWTTRKIEGILEKLKRQVT